MKHGSVTAISARLGTHMAKPLQRTPLEVELRKVLKHPDGVQGAEYLHLPLLQAALVRTERWTPDSHVSFAAALTEYLATLIDSMDDANPDPDRSAALQRALRVNLGIDTGPGGRHLTSSGRRDVGAAIAGVSLSAYYHDRAGKPPRILTVLLRKLIGRIAGPAEGPATAAGSPTSKEEQAHATRLRHADSFARAWDLLDVCRSSARERGASLEQLKSLADKLADQTDLYEARALVEFARYEGNRGLETYRLVQGVTLLEAALQTHTSRLGASLETGLRLVLMREWANLFLTGDQVPGDRNEYLNRVVHLADETLATTLDVMTEARLRVTVGEALKELAMVTHNATLQRRQYRRARAECDAVTEKLNGKSGADAIRLVAQAKRHAAITYELDADKEADEDRRRTSIEMWNLLSEQAAGLAAQVGDDSTSAYALLNAGSSQSRLTKFHGTSAGKRDALELGLRHLDTALPLLTALNDDRGQGWVHIHLCENTEQRARLAPAHSSARIQLLRELESHANHALAHLKHLEDHLGLTLAYLQLGKAIFMLHQEAGPDPASHVRLERASAVLSLALEMTSEIGYFQEATTTSRWLSRCLHNAWLNSDSSQPEPLVTAIHAQITGLCECYAGQGSTQQLEALFRELDVRLEGELRKHR